MRTKTFEAIKLLEIRKALGFTQSIMAKMISDETEEEINCRHIGQFENNNERNRYKMRAIEEWVIANWKLATKQ